MSGIVKPGIGAQLNLGHPMSYGLVGCWLLNEGSGIYTKDYSVNNNNGVLANYNDPPVATSGWNEGEHGGALVYDTVGDHINCGSAPELNFGNGTKDFPFSIVWHGTVTDSSNIRLLVGKELMSNHRQYSFHILDSDVLRLTILDQSTTHQAYRHYTFTRFGEQMFLTMTYNATGGSTAANGIVFYENGVLKTSTAVNDAAYTAMESFTDSPLEIGSRGGIFPSTGRVSSVMIYNRVLSPLEVKFLSAFPYCMFDDFNVNYIVAAAEDGILAAYYYRMLLAGATND